MAYEALDSLRQTLFQILQGKDALTIDILQEPAFSICDKLDVLLMNLKHYPEKETITEVAITTHEIILEFLASPDLFDCESIEPIISLSNELRGIAEGLESTVAHVVNNLQPPTDSQAVSSSSRLGKTTSKDVVVGLDEDLKVIKHQLSEGSFRLQVLPIVGVGGIGKTTLAQIVYNEALIMDDYHICAWVTVSQDYRVGSIVSNLLASIKGIGAERDVDGEIPLDSLIREYLHDRKYLIVMDDVCSKKAWDDVKMLFPDNYYRSRIILTTRQPEVAAYVASSSSIHRMRSLNANHSWNLLKQKVFAELDCPSELEDIGKEIAQGCGGLPLSIVVAAGLLSKIHKTRYLWEQVLANNAQLETIISFSYTHLPDHMKACFLYIAGFPEDYEIGVSGLTNLWVTEGFLKCSNESKSLEEEAKDCLEDLVERNLVLVTRRKFDGKIKSCSLHDIVRDFCVRQAGKEKLIFPVVDYLPTPILRRHFLPRLVKDHPRVSATSYDLRLKDYVHSSHICTIICIPNKGYGTGGSVEKFSSLRVLHVLRRSDHWDWEPGLVFDLIHLTYLASNIPTSIVPSTISKLEKLQTINIYRSEVRLPVEIWRLGQLRHLIAFSFDALPLPEVEALPLENLQTLSLTTDFVCSERMVEMIPNIRKLGICYLSTEIFDNDYRLNNLGHLCRLEKLKLEIGGGISYQPPAPGEIGRCVSFGQSLNPAFPLLLRSLTLSGWELQLSDMRIIGTLPNLQVLKLRNCACSGRLWETIEGEFGELRVLLLDRSDLVDWITESSHFPRLECLILRQCHSLYEIPSNIGDIPSLNLIEVDEWPRALLRSAKRIQKKRQNLRNDSFQVRVRRS